MTLNAQLIRYDYSLVEQHLRFCGVCALHDQLASLSRHAQLTRCFSAVAELLVVDSAAARLRSNLLKSIIK